jgi:uncharacterized delta-60 repeat protein
MKSLIFFILLLSSAITLAQPPDTLWTHTYGGNGTDYASSVQQTTDGGYIVTGYTSSFGVGGNDFYLVKTNSQGDTLWTRTYGGSNADVAFSVQHDTIDGGYIVAGYTESFGAGYYDIYLVKTNSQGDTLWTRTYGGSNADVAFSVQHDTIDGGYIVAGYTDSFGAGDNDFYLVKTNSQGDTLWTRTYGGNMNDYAYSVQQTTDGGYIIAGCTGSIGVGGDFYLVKTNSQGDTLWTRTYGGGSPDAAHSVEQTTDGGYIVVGRTESFGAGYYDFYLVKTNSQGDTLWTRTYGGSEDDDAFSVQQTTDGGYIVVGWTAATCAGYDDFYLIKTNTQGDTLWTRAFGGSGLEIANSVKQTSDGGYIAAGFTESFGAGSMDFYLVKLGAESSVEPISLLLPFRYSLHPNYPNPFNPVTRISYDLPSPSMVNLEIFDLLGRKVASLTNGIQPAGTYSIIFDGSAFPSGLYFYRLQASNFIQTQKMILLK